MGTSIEAAEHAALDGCMQLALAGGGFLARPAVGPADTLRLRAALVLAPSGDAEAAGPCGQDEAVPRGGGCVCVHIHAHTAASPCACVAGGRIPCDGAARGGGILAEERGALPEERGALAEEGTDEITLQLPLNSSRTACRGWFRFTPADARVHIALRGVEVERLLLPRTAAAPTNGCCSHERLLLPRGAPSRSAWGRLRGPTEVLNDSADGARLREGRDFPKALRTRSANENIESPRSAHEHRPIDAGGLGEQRTLFEAVRMRRGDGRHVHGGRCLQAS